MKMIQKEENTPVQEPADRKEPTVVNKANPVNPDTASESKETAKKPVYATFNGEIIAQSDDTIVVEGNHCFPVADIREELLHSTSNKTFCPWKGVANYWNVEVDGIHAENAAWGYRRPWPLARRVKGRVAFYNEVNVDTEQSSHV